MPCATHVILKTGAGKVGLQPRSLYTFPLNPLTSPKIDSFFRGVAKKMTGYEILTRDTAILTSKNVGHASNFFFCWHTQCFGHVKSGCPRVENREKSQKIAKRVQIRWSLFTTFCPPYTFGPELTAVVIWGSGFRFPGTGAQGPHILSVMSSRPLKYGGALDIS